jgi:hypothetical protein
MGIMMTFSCAACGYSSDELTLGPAPYPDTFDPVLVTCTSCKAIRTLHRGRLTSGCEKHHVPYTVHDDEQAAPCPRCGTALQQTPGALWD